MKIDFNEARQDLPLNRSELARRIAETPLDVVLEYVSGLQQLKGNLDQYIAIMHAANSPCCEALLEQLPNERLADLQTIAEILNDNDILSRIDQLTDATWGNTARGKGNKDKINELLDSIKRLDQYKLETVASACVIMQQEYGSLSRILLFYLNKKRSNLALKRFLGKIDEKSIDSLISACSTMAKVYENMS